MYLNIAICDDEKYIVSQINSLLQLLSDEKGNEINVDTFYDGIALAEKIYSGVRYDIIYLDIEMKAQNGVETARRIRIMDEKVLIIYVTNHESFAKEAFEVSAYRFITKPIDDFMFKKYYFDACKELNPRYFQYQYNKISYRILIDDILYFQSDKRVTYIITNDRIEKYYGKLRDIENGLKNAGVKFYRTHQSFLVNPKYVKKYYYNTMELTDGTVLTISENRRKKVNELYCELKGGDIIV